MAVLAEYQSLRKVLFIRKIIYKYQRFYNNNNKMLLFIPPLLYVIIYSTKPPLDIYSLHKNTVGLYSHACFLMGCLSYTKWMFPIFQSMDWGPWLTLPFGVVGRSKSFFLTQYLPSAWVFPLLQDSWIGHLALCVCPPLQIK